MKPRIEYAESAPGAFQGMRAFEEYVHRCGLEPTLLELIKIRASQINGWNRFAISFRKVLGTYQSP